MRFDTATAPHVTGHRDSAALMREVLLALVPGIAVNAWWFGPGVLAQILVASASALAAEACVCLARRRPPLATLADCSALLCAWLLALCVPPLAPWWVVATGSAFAIVVAKQLFGGLGANVFNPAMAGYAALLVSFPLHMTQWPQPGAAGLAEVWSAVLLAAPPPDTLTGATALDTVRTRLGLGEGLAQVYAAPAFGRAAGAGWEWVALAYLGGGLWLLGRGAIRWHIPVAMLLALAACAALFHLLDPQRYASPLFHLAAGASVLGAFFIATDPVTAAASPTGRLVFAAGVGALTYVIRTWGGYPDGVAFAVLLMNSAAPAIDHFTRPRVYGSGRDRR